MLEPKSKSILIERCLRKLMLNDETSRNKNGGGAAAAAGVAA